MVRLTTYDEGWQSTRWGGSAGRVVVVDVKEAEIDRFWRTGGEAVEFANDMARKVTRRARIYAPKRSGELRQGIRVRYSRSTGKRSVMSSARSDARHTLWVHEGTAQGGRGYIVSPRRITVANPRQPGGTMVVPGTMVIPAGTNSEGRSYPEIRTKKVKGQASQPFLRRALQDEWNRVPNSLLRKKLRPGRLPLVLGGGAHW